MPGSRDLHQIFALQFTVNAVLRARHNDSQLQMLLCLSSVISEVWSGPIQVGAFSQNPLLIEDVWGNEL